MNVEAILRSFVNSSTSDSIDTRTEQFFRSFVGQPQQLFQILLLQQHLTYTDGDFNDMESQLLTSFSETNPAKDNMMDDSIGQPNSEDEEEDESVEDFEAAAGMTTGESKQISIPLSKSRQSIEKTTDASSAELPSFTSTAAIKAFVTDLRVNQTLQSQLLIQTTTLLSQTKVGRQFLLNNLAYLLLLCGTDIPTFYRQLEQSADAPSTGTPRDLISVVPLPIGHLATYQFLSAFHSDSSASIPTINSPSEGSEGSYDTYLAQTLLHRPLSISTAPATQSIVSIITSTVQFALINNILWCTSVFNQSAQSTQVEQFFYTIPSSALQIFLTLIQYSSLDAEKMSTILSLISLHAMFQSAMTTLNLSEIDCSTGTIFSTDHNRPSLLPIFAEVDAYMNQRPQNVYMNQPLQNGDNAVKISPGGSDVEFTPYQLITVTISASEVYQVVAQYLPLPKSNASFFTSPVTMTDASTQSSAPTSRLTATETMSTLYLRVITTFLQCISMLGEFAEFQATFQTTDTASIIDGLTSPEIWEKSLSMTVPAYLRYVRKSISALGPSLDERSPSPLQALQALPAPFYSISLHLSATLHSFAFSTLFKLIEFSPKFDTTSGTSQIQSKQHKNDPVLEAIQAQGLMNDEDELSTSDATQSAPADSNQQQVTSANGHFDVLLSMSLLELLTSQLSSNIFSVYFLQSTAFIPRLVYSSFFYAEVLTFRFNPSTRISLPAESQMVKCFRGESHNIFSFPSLQDAYNGPCDDAFSLETDTFLDEEDAPVIFNSWGTTAEHLQSLDSTTSNPQVVKKSLKNHSTLKNPSELTLFLNNLFKTLAQLFNILHEENHMNILSFLLPNCGLYNPNLFFSSTTFLSSPFAPSPTPSLELMLPTETIPSLEYHRLFAHLQAAFRHVYNSQQTPTLTYSLHSTLSSLTTHTAQFITPTHATMQHILASVDDFRDTIASKTSALGADAVSAIQPAADALCERYSQLLSRYTVAGQYLRLWCPVSLLRSIFLGNLTAHTLTSSLTVDTILSAINSMAGLLISLPLLFDYQLALILARGFAVFIHLQPLSVSITLCIAAIARQNVMFMAFPVHFMHAYTRIIGDKLIQNFPLQFQLSQIPWFNSVETHLTRLSDLHAQTFLQAGTLALTRQQKTDLNVFFMGVSPVINLVAQATNARDEVKSSVVNALSTILSKRNHHLVSIVSQSSVQTDATSSSLFQLGGYPSMLFGIDTMAAAWSYHGVPISEVPLFNRRFFSTVSMLNSVSSIQTFELTILAMLTNPNTVNALSFLSVVPLQFAPALDPGSSITFSLSPVLTEANNRAFANGQFCSCATPLIPFQQLLRQGTTRLIPFSTRSTLTPAVSPEINRVFDTFTTTLDQTLSHLSKQSLSVLEDLQFSAFHLLSTLAETCSETLLTISSADLVPTGINSQSVLMIVPAPLIEFRGVIFRLHTSQALYTSTSFLNRLVDKNFDSSHESAKLVFDWKRFVIQKLFFNTSASFLEVNPKKLTISIVYDHFIQMVDPQHHAMLISSGINTDLNQNLAIHPDDQVMSEDAQIYHDYLVSQQLVTAPAPTLAGSEVCQPDPCIFYQYGRRHNSQAEKLMLIAQFTTIEQMGRNSYMSASTVQPTVDAQVG